MKIHSLSTCLLFSEFSSYFFICTSVSTRSPRPRLRADVRLLAQSEPRSRSVGRASRAASCSCAGNPLVPRLSPGRSPGSRATPVAGANPRTPVHSPAGPCSGLNGVISVIFLVLFRMKHCNIKCSYAETNSFASVPELWLNCSQSVLTRREKLDPGLKRRDSNMKGTFLLFKIHEFKNCFVISLSFSPQHFLCATSIEVILCSPGILMSWFCLYGWKHLDGRSLFLSSLSGALYELCATVFDLNKTWSWENRLRKEKRVSKFHFLNVIK